MTPGWSPPGVRFEVKLPNSRPHVVTTSHLSLSSVAGVTAILATDAMDWQWSACSIQGQVSTESFFKKALRLQNLHNAPTTAQLRVRKSLCVPLAAPVLRVTSCYGLGLQCTSACYSSRAANTYIYTKPLKVTSGSVLVRNTRSILTNFHFRYFVVPY